MKKKRIIRNPMPKLDPERITGVRGIGVLPEVFKGFKSKGERAPSVNFRVSHFEHFLSQFPELKSII